MNGPATDDQQAHDITNMTLNNWPDTHIHLGPGIQTDLNNHFTIWLTQNA